MKKSIKKIKKAFKDEMAYARKIGYEGLLIPLSSENSENTCIYLDAIYDMATIREMILENGWHTDSLMINLAENSQRVIRMKEDATT
ncbi:MAG TPA: hypothetical protein ENK93_02695 [Campylobacteraceae bacterium]|jgi:hypothetical protein|nr:hypothetical protein [Campylobacteraceae bacterium]